MPGISYYSWEILGRPPSLAVQRFRMESSVFLVWGKIYSSVTSISKRETIKTKSDKTCPTVRGKINAGWVFQHALLEFRVFRMSRNPEYFYRRVFFRISLDLSKNAEPKVQASRSVTLSGGFASRFSVSRIQRHKRHFSESFLAGYMMTSWKFSRARPSRTKFSGRRNFFFYGGADLIIGA